MATNTPVSPMVEAPRRSPFLFLLAIASLALVVAAAFYLGLQKSAIIDEQKRLDEEVITLNKEISALESQKIKAAQLAQQWLESIQKEEILWSKVFTRIQALIPFDNVASQPKIKFLSYSGSQGGRISLNAQSRPAQQEPFADVAELISVFNASSFFSDAYVPSITRGENEVGDKILSFLFNMNYKEEEPEILSTPSVTPETDTPAPAPPPGLPTPRTPASSPQTSPASPETTSSVSPLPGTTIPTVSETTETTETSPGGVPRQ